MSSIYEKMIDEIFVEIDRESRGTYNPKPESAYITELAAGNYRPPSHRGTLKRSLAAMLERESVSDKKRIEEWRQIEQRRNELLAAEKSIRAEYEELNFRCSVEYVAEVIGRLNAITWLLEATPSDEYVAPETSACLDKENTEIEKLRAWLKLLQETRAELKAEIDGLEQHGGTYKSIGGESYSSRSALYKRLKAVVEAQIIAESELDSVAGMFSARTRMGYER